MTQTPTGRPCQIMCAVCSERPAEFSYHFRSLGGDIPLCSDDCADRFVKALTAVPDLPEADAPPAIREPEA